MLERAASPSSGVYGCTVQDYYVSSGRPTVLQIDSMTSMDKTSTSTTNSGAFTLTFPRTTGSTNGEDWEGGEFIKVCFFTSDIAFTQSTWERQYEVCYGYQVNNYVSTYRGSDLGTMDFEGVSSNVYGGIYGPNLQLQLYWFRGSTSISNTSALTIRVGNQISSDLGYDFFVCGSGDYYGASATALSRDLVYSGYENGACTYTVNSQSISLTYSRDIFTFDSFDAVLGQVVNICIIGSQTGCSELTLPINFPVMTVESALTIFEGHLGPLHKIVLLILILLTYL